MKRLTAVRLGIAGVIRSLVVPLLPEPGTTEASVYFGLVLIAAGCLVAGQPALALIVPGAVVTFLGSAPAIVGILAKGRS